MDKGGGRASKEAPLVTLPCGVMMVMGPEVASGGMTAVRRRSALLAGALVKLALAPLNRTAIAPVKLVPVRVILEPGVALEGESWLPVKPGRGVGYHASLKVPTR